MKTLRRPLFLVLEGIDGAGKTTQASRLVERLEREGYPVRRLVEPTHGPIGTEIRRRAADGPPMSPEEELDLFLRDRRENVEQNLRPALARNEVVVQDRSFLSTVAYQGARPALGRSREQLLALHEAIPKPDLILLLDLDVDAGLARVTKRAKPDAFEDRAYLARVLENFRALTKDAAVRVRAVDATRPADVVFDELWSIVAPLLAERAS